MSNDLETAALIAVLRRKQVPANRLAELVETAGSAQDVLYEADNAEPTELFPENGMATGSADEDLDRALRDLSLWANEGIRAVSVLDPDYPLNLRTVHDRPALLFVRGALVSGDAHSVAVVGARKASEEGRRRSGRLARQLTEAGYVIASGLAEGIDTAAHRGALDAGGRTVAVVGTGLRETFPKSNAMLQRQLGTEAAVISQFWPDQGARKWTFPLRNAVMSGFALATAVVEASHTSGARMQARLALEHGRPVFFLQSLVEQHKWAQTFAQRPGVYVVASTDEVVDMLGRLYADDLSIAF